MANPSFEYKDHLTNQNSAAIQIQWHLGSLTLLLIVYVRKRPEHNTVPYTRSCKVLIFDDVMDVEKSIISKCFSPKDILEYLKTIIPDDLEFVACNICSQEQANLCAYLVLMPNILLFEIILMP